MLTIVWSAVPQVTKWRTSQLVNIIARAIENLYTPFPLATATIIMKTHYPCNNAVAHRWVPPFQPTRRISVAESYRRAVFRQRCAAISSEAVPFGFERRVASHFRFRIIFKSRRIIYWSVWIALWVTICKQDLKSKHRCKKKLSHWVTIFDENSKHTLTSYHLLATKGHH